jgi:hypothetical protein
LSSKPIRVSSFEYPPVLTISSSKKQIGPEDFFDVNVSVLSKTAMAYALLEIEVVGPLDNLKTVYADFHELRDLKPLHESSVSKKLFLSVQPEGEYIVVARLKKDYSPIITAQYFFRVVGYKGFTSLKWVALFALVFFISFFALRKIIIVKKAEGKLIIPAEHLFNRMSIFSQARLLELKNWLRKSRRKPKRAVKKPRVKRKKPRRKRRVSEEQKILRRVDRLIKEGGNV